MSGFFIVGAPRSGTTLLQSILSSHHEIFSAPETSFFVSIIPLLGIQYYNPDCPTTEKDIIIIKENFRTMTGIQPCINAAIKPGTPIKRVFEELLSGFNKDGKPKWIEKTTNHARCMLAIQRFYPEGKFIHVIRDPVDSVASMANLRPISVSDLRIAYISSYYGFARLWKECVVSALRYPNQENVLHVFYEDLVIHPKMVLYRVCRFLEVSFEASLMDSFHKTAESLFSKESCPWQKDNLLPGFHTDAVHKWRRQLPVAKVWLIQKYTQDLARYFGYYETIERTSTVLILLNVIIDQIRLVISSTRVENMIRKLIIRIVK